ncbi:MAG TPA: response regulator transcription factor [Polyangiaceae bacterium]|nr:response regulator transcription factor [Polyangiaceae bacterium]
MHQTKHILLVDDEKRIREVVEYALVKAGYRVTALAEGEPALGLIASDPPDLVVLDIGLPGIDGLELCKRIRARGSTPVLFLSARADEVDRIVGLELGGDDYLVKPFSPRELVARVRAVLRRFEASEAQRAEVKAEAQRAEVKAPARILRSGKLEIDAERFEVRWEDSKIALTATEFAVLAALYERPGIVLSRAQLLERAYRTDVHVTERTLDTHVRRIRAKFREFGEDPIATVHGVGYKASSS